MMQKEKKCYREFYEKAGRNIYRKVKREAPCRKKRCQDGQLAKPKGFSKIYKITYNGKKT